MRSFLCLVIVCQGFGQDFESQDILSEVVSFQGQPDTPFTNVQRADGNSSLEGEIELEFHGESVLFTFRMDLLGTTGDGTRIITSADVHEQETVHSFRMNSSAGDQLYGFGNSHTVQYLKNPINPQFYTVLNIVKGSGIFKNAVGKLVFSGEWIGSQLSVRYFKGEFIPVQSSSPRRLTFSQKP